MSNKGDQCFQCQELGHNACHCPNVCCFDCDEYGHIAVDCPDRIPPSGTLACHKRHHSHTRHYMPDQLLANTTGTGTDIAGQDHSHTPTDIRSHSHNNSHRSHSRSHHRCTLQDTITPALITITMTHHTGDQSSCRSLSTHSRDCSRSRSCTSYKPSKNTSSKSSSSSSKTTVKPQDKKQKKVMIDMPAIRLLQLRWHLQWLWRWFKLKKPSLSNAPHEQGGPSMEETITIVVHIMDCPTITIHAGKCYKALIDSEATISLLQYSIYKNIEDSYKTSI